MKRLVMFGFWLFVLFVLSNGPALGSDLFVTPSGFDAGSCGDATHPCRTIQYAIDHALDDDTIKVARGTYGENLRVWFGWSVDGYTIQGGWNADFTARDADPAGTVIDGGGRETVIVYDSGYHDQTLTIEGFTVQHGEADEHLGGGMDIRTSLRNQTVILENNIFAANSGINGGGITAEALEGGSLNLLLRSNRIVSNSGLAGGGIRIHAGTDSSITATLTNTIVANNYDTWCIGSDGIYLRARRNSAASLELINNTFVDDGVSVNAYDSEGPAAPVAVNITNTIIDGTLGLDYFSLEHLQVRLSNSIITSVYGGSGGLPEMENMVYTSDPLFVDPAAGDYHLQDDSPAVGQGICGNVIRALNPADDRYERIAPYTDFDGDLRPPDWVATGCDIGADEVIPLIPAPAGQDVYAYDPRATPALMDQARDCAPFASGDLSGGTLNMRVALPRFETAVDVYLGLLLGPIDAANIYLVHPDQSLHALGESITPWRADSPGNIDYRLYGEVPLSLLPTGRYDAFVLVTPAGSLATHYLWTTYFEIP